MGIPNNSEEIHERNFVLSNIRSGSSYTGKNKSVQCSGFRIRTHPEFRINVETVELIGRALGINDYMASRISTKICLKIQQGCKERDFGAGDLVLRKVIGNTPDVNAGKLAST